VLTSKDVWDNQHQPVYAWVAAGADVRPRSTEIALYRMTSFPVADKELNKQQPKNLASLIRSIYAVNYH